MKIKTSSDYMASLQAIKPLIYYMGKKIGDVTTPSGDGAPRPGGGHDLFPGRAG